MQISHPGQIRAPRNWQLAAQEAPPPSQQPLRFSQSRKHRQMVHLRGTMAILPPSTREAKTSLNGVPANFASIPSVPFVRSTVAPLNPAVAVTNPDSPFLEETLATPASGGVTTIPTY